MNACFYVWMLACIQSFFSCVALHILPISRNKYDSHIANMSHTAIMLHGHTDPLFFHVSATTQSTAISTSRYCHVCVNNKYASQIPHICHICELLHVHIWNNDVSTFAWCELTAINNVTRNTSIHTFYIIGICPRTNMLATLHILVLLL